VSKSQPHAAAPADPPRRALDDLIEGLCQVEADRRQSLCLEIVVPPSRVRSFATEGCGPTGPQE
jgi:hypothetical protein